MHRHIDLGKFEQRYPFLERFESNGKTVYLMNLYKVGIVHNFDLLCHIMELLAKELEFWYFDGRIYSIEAEKDKIVIKSKM